MGLCRSSPDLHHARLSRSQQASSTPLPSLRHDPRFTPTALRPTLSTPINWRTSHHSTPELPRLNEVVRAVERIRAGGSSPPPCEAEANTKPVVSNPISSSEVHFDNASARAAADRNHLPSDPATTSQAVPRTDAAMGSTASAATSRRPGETLARTKPTSAAESRPAHVAQTGLDRVAPVVAVTVEASTPTVSPASAKPDGQKPALPIMEGPIIPIGGRPYRLLQRNPPGRVR